MTARLLAASLWLLTANTVSSAVHGQTPIPYVPVASRAETASGLSFDLSPDGRWIVLDLLGQIWRVRASGGEAQALTDAIRDAADSQEPRFSPDGQTIVFRKGLGFANPVDSRLWQLSLVSGTSLPLTPDSTPLHAPAWHPSGTRLVAVKLGPETGLAPRDELVLYDPATRTTATLPADTILGAAPGVLRTPAWSPDGNRVAVVGIPMTGFVEDGAIWEIDIATGAARRITPEGWIGRAPAWSPDGQWLAFVGGPADAEHQLHILRLADGSVRRLTDRPATLTRAPWRFGRAVWTPDGARVLYAWEGRLWSVGVKGGESAAIPFSAEVRFERSVPVLPPVDLPQPGARQQARGFTGLALSPDAERLALLALDHVWIVTRAGAVERGIPVPGTAAGLSWSPEGSALVFSAGPRGEEDLYVVGAAGGAPRRLPSLPGREVRPAWSPDSRHITFLHFAPPGETPPRSVRVIAPDARSADEIRSLGSMPPGIATGITETEQNIVPQWTADGDAVLIHSGGGRATRIPLEGERSTMRVPTDASFMRWLSDDSVVFVRGTRLHAARVPGPDVSAVAAAIAGGPALYPAVPARDGSILYTGADGLVIRHPDGRESVVGWPIEYEVPRQEPLVVHNARVLDAAAGRMGEPVDILVLNGRITQIAPAGAIHRTGSERWLDAGGRIVMPGLIDAHAHPYDEAQLRGMLYYGVTTARTLGNSIARDAALRDGVASGALAGPRLVTGGFQFYVGCRRTECPTDERIQLTRDDAAMARALAVARTFGSDVIKLYHAFDYAAAIALISAAHSAGLRVTGHDARPA
jgi:Tol biopolymer transport system component